MHFNLILVIIGITCIACATSSSYHKGTSTLYLVRHAEKVDDGSKDPMLTDLGEQRAQQLADMLRDKEIEMIYSSNYQRTMRTAQPLASLLGLSIQQYDPRDLSSLAERLKKKGKNALIVGHSNSTPSLANTLLDMSLYSSFDESDYTNLLVIKIQNGIVIEHANLKF